MNADVVANTSESEGMSGALVEAMAAGTNVVARGVEGNVALLDPPAKADGAGIERAGTKRGDNLGFRTSSSGALIFDTPAGFTSAIEMLRTNTEKAAALSMRQRSFARKQLSPASEEQGYKALLRSIVKAPREGR